ncbi:MAG: hypothetical protein ACXWMU_05440 [Candidatus Limnocylindrales bacterium]
MNRLSIGDLPAMRGTRGSEDPTIELEPAVVALCGEARTAFEVLGGATALRVRTYARREGGAATTLLIAYAPDSETVA